VKGVLEMKRTALNPIFLSANLLHQASGANQSAEHRNHAGGSKQTEIGEKT
jgi:hypothetical protein